MLGPFKARGLPCLREVPWLVVWRWDLSLGLGLLSFFLLLLVVKVSSPTLALVRPIAEPPSSFGWFAVMWVRLRAFGVPLMFI